MADKILDVRSVMDEMVSPQGLQAGGGGGGVTVDDFVAGAGIEIMPDFLTESKIQISVDPSIVEVGDTFYANIDIPDNSHGDHSDLLLTTDRPSLAYFGTVGADEAIFYDDNGNTFTPSGLRAYMMTHAMKSIQVTIRDYNSKKIVIEAKYNSNSGRMFNGTELGTGSDLVISDQTITIAGHTYKAMPIYYASFTYDQINQTVDWDVHGQLEAADSLIGSVIGTQSISTGETVTGAINTLIDDTIYSTTEKVVGTWIDGKPIYRKCGYISGPVDIGINTHYLVDSVLNSSYIENLINTGGSAVNANNVLLIGGYTDSSTRLNIGAMTNGLCLLNTDSTYTVSKIAWWVEYTKTTD